MHYCAGKGDLCIGVRVLSGEASTLVKNPFTAPVTAPACGQKTSLFDYSPAGSPRSTLSLFTAFSMSEVSG